jgi:asparagine synthase (glutamine-hydrolysing)
MCGIVGIFGSEESRVDRRQVENALNRIKHRGPDDSGVTSFCECVGEIHALGGSSVTTDVSAAPASASGFLGHQRLSILDLTRAGRQPMCSSDGKTFIAFNGEIYNYVELRQSLSRIGHRFVTGTDTEVALAAFKEWGAECFQRFNGMWAIAIVDLWSQEIILSRDRFGIKPLYVSRNGDHLGFASEIDALVAANCAEPRARIDVVRDFLVYGQMPIGTKTFFKDVHQIEPGSYTRFSLPGLIAIEEDRWWRISPDSLDQDAETGAWRELFLNSVELRMRSDVPVGSCLSGGLDSSAVVCGATANRQLSYDFNTFTSCYREPKYDERRFAKEVAEHVGAKPHWVYPGEETSLLGDLEDLVEVQGEPFPTLSIYSQYCVMRNAHEAGIKVLLDGQGADELLVGYDYALALQIAIELRNFRLMNAGRLVRRLRKEREGLSYSRLMSLVAYNGAPIVSAARNHIRASRYLGEAIKSSRSQFHSSVGVPQSLSEARQNWVERHPLPHLLRYEDRNSMAFSIETRLPFLDFRLVNLAFGLSDAAINSEGWPKFIIRQSMAGLVPENILWRKSKMGFPAPTVELMMQNRQEFSRLFGADARSGSLLRTANVKQLFESGSLEKWHWRLISLELWMRAFGVVV